LLEIDSRYWERKEYDTLTSPTKQPTTSGKANTSTNQNMSKASDKTSVTPKPTTSSMSEKTNDLAKKLGKDGKLLPEERQ
jgi:hypothetical protein